MQNKTKQHNTKPQDWWTKEQRKRRKTNRKKRQKTLTNTPNYLYPPI